ncbi:MAG TPA: cytochrome-c peroxidase, partial [Nitrospirota bacterium]
MFRMILITMSLFLIPFAGPVTAADLAPVESLGRALFFDPQLSNPPGQSCASCHDPAVGWTGPDPALNATGAVMEGAVHTRYGNRKPPSSAYAGFNPALHCVMSGAGPGGGGMGSGGMGGGMGNGGMGTGGICEGKFAGGMFWDGRATGWTLGDPLAEQAMGPFQNPLEMNSPNQKLVCLKVRESVYAGLFEEIWGANSLDCVKDVGTTYERIAQAIAAYERSTEVNP